MNHLRKFINWVTNVTYFNKSTAIIEIFKQSKDAGEVIDLINTVEKWSIPYLIQIRKDNTDLINDKKVENEKITKYLGLNTPVNVSVMDVVFDEPIKNNYC